jgi:hypothetical protein
VSLANAIARAAERQLEQGAQYGRLLWTGDDGIRCFRAAEEDPESYLPMTLTVVEIGGKVRTRYEYRAGLELPGTGGHMSSAVSPVEETPARRSVPDWVSESKRKQREPAPVAPTVPIDKGDSMTFVHTVRAGLGERRQLALILADSAERCRLLPRFAELFKGWADALWNVADDQPVDVVLQGNGFGWGHKADRAELERLLRIARDRQSAPSPSMNALHRAAATAAYEPDGNPGLIEPPEPDRHRIPDDVTSTLQRMSR